MLAHLIWQACVPTETGLMAAAPSWADPFGELQESQHWTAEQAAS